MSLHQAVVALFDAFGLDDDGDMKTITDAFCAASAKYDEAANAFTNGDAELGRKLAGEARALADHHALLSEAWRGRTQTRQ
jgi:hypothetical protein